MSPLAPAAHQPGQLRRGVQHQPLLRGAAASGLPHCSPIAAARCRRRPAAAGAIRATAQSTQQQSINRKAAESPAQQQQAAAAAAPPPPPPAAAAAAQKKKQQKQQWQGVRPPFKRSDEVVAMILGGGPGTDLWPLTHTRAEPAVPFAGLFRLIDVPVSNCLHSGISNVYVLTQYNATSLNRHLSRAYRWVNGAAFTGHGGGFVESLSASQRPGLESSAAWFQGTADAVRRVLDRLQEAKHAGVEDVLILSGDQLYRMDYTALINAHRARGADVTIATTPADEDMACRLGVLTVDAELNVLEFHEKPPRAVLATMSVDWSALETYGGGFAGSEAEAHDKPYVASMGMYVFKVDVLVDLLTRRFPQANDFSRDILSLMHGELHIAAWAWHGYWEDVGSLKDYYAANMAMAADTSRLMLFDPDMPLYSEARVLPPSRVEGGLISDSLLGDGCRVEAGGVVRRSILGSCAYVGAGAFVEDTIIFGADNLDASDVRAAELAAGRVPLGVGANARLRRCIIDSNARIGARVSLTNAAGVVEGGSGSSAAGGGKGGGLPEGVVIRDGILVVMRGAVVPDGTVV